MEPADSNIPEELPVGILASMGVVRREPHALMTTAWRRRLLQWNPVKTRRAADRIISPSCQQGGNFEDCPWYNNCSFCIH